MTEVNGTHLNKITQGDAIEEMRKLADKSVDMILCDLPYGTTACKWDTIIPFEPLWAEYERVIKDDGAIVLTASQPFTSALVMSNPKLFRHEWVWQKSRASNFVNAKYAPMKYHESVVVFAKSKAVYNPQMVEGAPYKTRHSVGKAGGGEVTGEHEGGKDVSTRYPNSIIKVPNMRQQDVVHPTQKPVKLFEYLLLTYTNEGDVILDNCIGSGTTAVAALNTNRNFIGIEREPEYVAIANQRITEARK